MEQSFRGNVLNKQIGTFHELDINNIQFQEGDGPFYCPQLFFDQHYQNESESIIVLSVQ